MNLTKFLENLFKEDGFVLVDANSREYIIGKPKKNVPIKIKLLDKSLHYKLLLLPDLYFGEAYTDGSLVIENGTLTEFLDIAMKNIGRGETNLYAMIIKKIRGTFRYLTNYNLISKSKNNVAHHYDISEKLYDLFLDKNRQYSCAYFKNDNDNLEEAQNRHVWILTSIVEMPNEGRKIMHKTRAPSRTPSNNEIQKLIEELKENDVDTVWVTPKLPLLAFLWPSVLPLVLIGGPMAYIMPLLGL